MLKAVWETLRLLFQVVFAIAGAASVKPARPLANPWLLHEQTYARFVRLTMRNGRELWELYPDYDQRAVR